MPSTEVSLIVQPQRMACDGVMHSLMARNHSKVHWGSIQPLWNMYPWPARVWSWASHWSQWVDEAGGSLYCYWNISEVTMFVSTSKSALKFHVISRMNGQQCTGVLFWISETVSDLIPFCLLNRPTYILTSHILAIGRVNVAVYPVLMSYWHRIMGKNCNLKSSLFLMYSLLTFCFNDHLQNHFAIKDHLLL